MPPTRPTSSATAGVAGEQTKILDLGYPFSLLCEVTFRCPLQCPYCSNPLAFARSLRDELETKEWIRVLEEAAGLGVLQANFSGGEPLLRKDLPELIGAAHALGLYTNLSTGGTLLTSELAGKLKEAGLAGFQLSIQDSRPESAEWIAGMRGSFVKKAEAARVAREAGFALGINAVLHRQNLDRIEEIIALAEEWGAERLELANAQYNGWALENRRWLLPTRAQVEQASNVAAAAQARLKGKMDLLFVIPDYYATYPKACLHGWGRAFLTVSADGQALPCQAAREITSLSFPNVREKSLRDIWFDSEAFNRFRGVGWLPEPCRSCPRRDIDFGGCRCQAFLLTQDAGATDPACILSPHHHRIEEALAEAETRETVAWSYRNPIESKRLSEAEPRPTPPAVAKPKPTG
ncbi:MAG: pyrroloquinoline quinone biosynthesis protein PqqE [Methylacidiphilaceae bacterium]|nr:pyrroloquinoline quinone biosynthesis protein PqqE [Candidatus Methylacidiphilaceae bacterium]